MIKTAQTQPSVFFATCARLLPNDVRVTVEQALPGLSPEDGAGDGGAITSHRISVTRLRYRLEMRSGLWRIMRCRQAKTGRSAKRGAP
jgi:hypothetical protein